jgi:hypothetical protein
VSDTNTLGLVLTFAGVCVVNGGAVAIVWIQGKTRSDRTDAKIDQVGVGVDTAATEAATAAKRVEPVSNGFADKVLSSLAALTTDLAAHGDELHEVREKLDRHIGDHAAADVRRGGGG